MNSHRNTLEYTALVSQVRELWHGVQRYATPSALQQLPCVFSGERLRSDWLLPMLLALLTMGQSRTASTQRLQRHIPYTAQCNQECRP